MMSRSASFAAALLLAGCGGNPHPGDSVPVPAPSGALFAPIFDRDACGRDPACICTMRPEDRPDTIPVPQMLREIDPSLPEFMSYDCFDQYPAQE